ncbi:MAG TPA: S9 family peptidase [Vicinamibacterales bacterium]|jgi:dipeptidyl aminopeptidase/acylaminoacyl peptidase|nr:S9 family peptidase [Vicinamibacterales bacterium]
MRYTLVVLAVALALASVHAQSTRPAPLAPPLSLTAPTVDQILSLKRATSAEISPDGHWVAYTVRDTNWDENAYETQIWLADTESGVTRQLTHAKKSSTNPSWSPDGSRIAFASDRSDKRQIYLINPTAGEADALTTADSAPDGVDSFAWSPDGKTIAFTATEPKSSTIKDREKKYGEFQVVDHDYRLAQLFLLDVTTRAIRPLTHAAYHVGSFEWSPDSRNLAFDHRANPSPGASGSADISIVGTDGVVRDLVTQAGPDFRPVWSPDGSRIAFETSMANPSYFYSNTIIATVPVSGGTPTPLTTSFDEDPSIVAWKPSGLYFSASHHTSSSLYRLNPETRATARLAPSDAAIESSFSLSKVGDKIAFLDSGPNRMAEVCVASIPVEVAGSDARNISVKKLTEMTDQTSGWATSTLDVISWKSRDGAEIEGVLHKPLDFDPARKYPLLVVIHGGPTGISRPVPFTSAIYPIDIWVPRGVLVLEPNYRGSAGYGEKFRALNVRNLGVGDAWDVLSGVDALIAKGMVDATKIGAMGWSQGGYISAFLTTHDAARFKAISVGAGISDWMTYYVNTDIHPFTRQYLKGTPWDDPEIYAKTSPITYVKQAKTPTLIQHGATDQRVPLPNAFELYQGLQDVNVPVKLIVYQGFGGIGHGPTKPKSYRATMDHNLEWFDQYLFQNTARSTAAQNP